MALSWDLRLRIVDLVASGVSRRDAARRFKVSASSAVRFVRQTAEVGHVEVKKPKKRKSKLDPRRANIAGWIGERNYSPPCQISPALNLCWDGSR